MEVENTTTIVQEESSPITPQVQKVKTEPGSQKTSVNVSGASKQAASTSSSPSAPHSVSVTAVSSAKKSKPPDRPNVIFTSVQAPVSGAASSLKELTISPARSSQSTVIQSISSAGNVSVAVPSEISTRPAPVSVIRKASHEPPSVSVESFTFKTPSPMRPSRSVKPTSDVIKPSVSVCVVKSDSLNQPAATSPIAQRRQLNSGAPSVKIASFAKSQPSTSAGLIVNVPDKDAPSKKASSHISSSKPPPKSDTSSSSSSVSFPLQKKKFISSSRSASSFPASNASSQGSVHKPSHSSSTAANSHDTNNGNASDDDEEILVYVQFDSQLDSDLLEKNTPFNIIGLDSEKPILQLGDQVFQGDWHDTVGTAVFFEEDVSNALAGDPVFTKIPEQPLKYHSRTRKSLHMSRIFIKPKEPESAETEDRVLTTENEEEIGDLDTEEMSSIEEIIIEEPYGMCEEESILPEPQAD